MADVRIRLTATDETGKVFEGSIEGLDKLEHQAQRTVPTYERLGQVADAAAHAIARGANIAARLELTQISLKQSADRVAEAQDKYNATVVEFGEGSREAIAAHKDLEQAEAVNEKTVLRSRIAYTLAGAEIVSMAAKIPKLVAMLEAYSVAQIGATAAAAGFAAVAVPALVGVAAGLAIVGAEGKLIDKILGREDVAKLAQTEEGLAEIRLEFARMASFREEHPFLARISNNAGKLVGWIPGMTTASERFKQLGDALAADALETGADNLAAVAEEIERLDREAETALAAASSGLGNLGINLAALGPATLTGLGGLGGAMGDLATRALGARQAEDALTASALRSSKALRDQATVTALKDETTEQFVQRLVDMGFQEDEIRDRVDMSTRTLLSQTEALEARTRAMERATDRTREFEQESARIVETEFGAARVTERGFVPFTGPIPAATPRPSAPTTAPPGSTSAPSGTTTPPPGGQAGTPPQQSQPSAGRAPQPQAQQGPQPSGGGAQAETGPFQPGHGPAFGTIYNAQVVQAGRVHQWILDNAPMFESLRLSKKEPYTVRWFMKNMGQQGTIFTDLTVPGEPASQREFGNQEVEPGGGVPGNQFSRPFVPWEFSLWAGHARGSQNVWDQQRTLRIMAAARGFEGLVREPTLFLAGESGAEQVQIQSTQGARAAVFRDINVTVVVQRTNASPDDIAAAVTQALPQTLRRMVSRSS